MPKDSPNEKLLGPKKGKLAFLLQAFRVFVYSETISLILKMFTVSYERKNHKMF